MTVVYCPELVPLRSKFWTKEKDDILRRGFNEVVRVDLTLLALSVGLSACDHNVRRVRNRLRELDLLKHSFAREQKTRSVYPAGRGRKP